MKIYVLLPLHRSKPAKIKDRDYRIARSALTHDYSRCFGIKNEYYVDLASQKYSISDVKIKNYSSQDYSWYYTALNPRDVIKKRIVKDKEVKA